MSHTLIFCSVKTVRWKTPCRFRHIWNYCKNLSVFNANPRRHHVMDHHQIATRWLVDGVSVGVLQNCGSLKARKKKINKHQWMANFGRFWLVTLAQFWVERVIMTNNPSTTEEENQHPKPEVISSRSPVKHFSTQLISFIDFYFLINSQKQTNRNSPSTQQINSILWKNDCEKLLIQNSISGLLSSHKFFIVVSV